MKISVIGAGMVGTDIISYLFNMGSFKELVLVDLDKDKSYAEMMDFRHTQSLFYTKNTKLSYGDYEKCADSDIVIITAGAQIKVGDTRESIAQVNSQISVSIVKELEKVTPNSILVFVSNPVDIVTYFAIKNSTFKWNKVISSGTLLDSSRLSYQLSLQYKVDPKNINSYVLGEHGKSCFIPWSLCNIYGTPLDRFSELNNIPKVDKEKSKEYVLESGLEIFAKKGNTNHGIAASVFRICQAISADERSVLPLGVYVEDLYGIKDIVLSLPCVLSKNGVEEILKIDLKDDELEELKISEKFLKEVINKVQI